MLTIFTFTSICTVCKEMFFLLFLLFFFFFWNLIRFIFKKIFIINYIKSWLRFKFLSIISSFLNEKNILSRIQFSSIRPYHVNIFKLFERQCSEAHYITDLGILKKKSSNTQKCHFLNINILRLNKGISSTA